MTNLYQFKNFGQQTGAAQNRLNGAPRLAPAGGFNYAASNSKNYIGGQSAGYSLIDVINEFQWTSTPKVGRQEVPAIYLKEKRLVTNALIAQAIYYGLALAPILGGGVAGFNALPNNLKSVLLGVGGAFLGGQVGSAIGNLVGGLGRLGSAFAGGTPTLAAAAAAGQGLSGPLGALAGFFGGVSAPIEAPSLALGLANDALQSLQNIIPTHLNVESLASDVLKPYEGLYITEDTKFLYNIPYFNDNFNTVSNQFGEQDQAFSVNPMGVQNLTNAMRDFAMGLSTTFNMTAPGIYIEKPQFFQFGHSYGDVVNLTFPLINTGWATFEDVVKNWQLIFMLVYQNKPNRRSRDLIDPPCIYEVTIPGVKYYPFAYINRMSVNFKGARRRMNVPVPYGGGITNINTIVPDAYVIDIQLQSLIPESQNFLYSMLSDKQNMVTVTNRFNPASEAQRLLQSSFNQVQQSTTTSSAAQAASNFISNISNNVNLAPQRALGGIANMLGNMLP